MSKRTASLGSSSGTGSLVSGALTGASTLVVSGVAAIVGVVIAREFGRSEETDGLLAAYGVFIVIVIAAQAIRVAVLPQLARARDEERLASEVTALALALAVVAVPLVLFAEFAAGAFAAVLTGESDVARDTAADALRWVVPAAALHLFAALGASGLAALDDYGTAAFGYAAGSVAGLALILARVDPDGIIAVAWGMALNGAVVVAVTAVGLAVHAVREDMPRHAMRPAGDPLSRRLGAFATSASLPLGLQLLYVICLPFAARLGTGSATSFVYAYLASSMLVTVTASSLALVTSVPLTRAGLTQEVAPRHVAAASWLALALIAPAAGVLAVAGGELIGAVLGSVYGGDVGAEIGGLIALMSAYMVGAVALTLAFPLVFIARRAGRLPLIAAIGVSVQVPAAWAGAELFGLEGLAVSLGATTWLLVSLLLAQLDALGPTLARLARAVVPIGLVALMAFGVGALVLGPYPGAALGLVLYAGLLTLLRPQGLRASWRYVRSLG